VEGHISGKSDSSHKGKVGRSYRSDIIQDAEPTSISEKISSATGSSPAASQSIGEEIEKMRAELTRLEERVEDNRDDVDSLDAYTNSIESAVMSHAETSAKQTASNLIDKHQLTADEIVDEAIDDVKSSVESFLEEKEERNQELKEKMDRVGRLLATIVDNKKVQCPACKTKVKFESENKIIKEYKGGNSMGVQRWRERDVYCPNCEFGVENLKTADNIEV
jgi:vacuolar-type H+-ATPase subunit I/STV1